MEASVSFFLFFCLSVPDGLVGGGGERQHSCLSGEEDAGRRDADMCENREEEEPDEYPFPLTLRKKGSSGAPTPVEGMPNGNGFASTST